MIKLDTQFNVDLLKSYVEMVKNYGPPIMKKTSGWGGWSVTSSDGTVEDGWQGGERLFIEDLPESERNKVKKEFENKIFNRPTPLYTDEIRKVIKQIEEMGFKALRIRVVILKPHAEAESYWHQDGSSENGAVKLRLHIPVITNPLCTFEYVDQKFHFPADGSSYIIDVSKRHRVLNLSDEERYHIMMDIYSKV